MHIPEDAANVRYLFRCEGIADTMGFSLACVPPLDMTPEQLAVTSSAQWEFVWAPAPSSLLEGWSYLGTQVTIVHDGEPFPGEHAESIVGTGGFQSVTCNTAILIKKNTALGGRHGRGRMFWPPFNTSEAKVEPSGQLDATWQANLQDGMESWYDLMTSNLISPVLLHTEPDSSATPILSFTVMPQCATQRRRMR